MYEKYIGLGKADLPSKLLKPGENLIPAVSISHAGHNKFPQMCGVGLCKFALTILGDRNLKSSCLQGCTLIDTFGENPVHASFTFFLLTVSLACGHITLICFYHQIITISLCLHLLF